MTEGERCHRAGSGAAPDRPAGPTSSSVTTRGARERACQAEDWGSPRWASARHGRTPRHHSACPPRPPRTQAGANGAMPAAHGGRLLPYSVDASAAENPAEEARNEQATDSREEPATLSLREGHQAHTPTGPPHACPLSANTSFPKPALCPASPLLGPLRGHHPNAERNVSHL